MTKAISILVAMGIAGVLFCSSAARSQTNVAQNWIDGWNSTDPEKLVAAFTPDGVYEDVAFGITKKAAQSCASCTNSSTTRWAASTSSLSIPTLQTATEPSSGFSAGPTSMSSKQESRFRSERQRDR